MAKLSSVFRCVLHRAGAAFALTAAFALGALAIPPIARALFSKAFLQSIALNSAPGLIARGQRLDEVKKFLDGKIAQGAYDPRMYALRGRLETRQKGPEAGFQYFAGLLRWFTLQEEIAPLAEWARTCALAGRWEDFFALCSILHDYGEVDFINQLFLELTRAGCPVAEALRSPDGLRFIAFAEWDKAAAAPVELPQEAQASLLRMWQLERDLRLEGSTVEAGPCEDVARERPEDLRAAFIKHNRAEAGVSDPAQRTPFPPAEQAALLGPNDFTHNGRKMSNGFWVSKGLYEAAFNPPKPEAVWFVAEGTPVLGVYPLVLAELDGDVSIHYLHCPRPFPELLRRRDGRPFQRISISFVNDFKDESLGQDRNIVFQGAYAVDPSFLRSPAAQGPASAPSP